MERHCLILFHLFIRLVLSLIQYTGILCNCIWTHNVTLTLAFQNNA